MGGGKKERVVGWENETKKGRKGVGGGRREGRNAERTARVKGEGEKRRRNGGREKERERLVDEDAYQRRNKLTVVERDVRGRVGAEEIEG